MTSPSDWGGGDGANNSYSPDALRPVGGASAVLQYFGSGIPRKPEPPRGGPEPTATPAPPAASEDGPVGPLGHDDPSLVAGIVSRQGQSRVVFFGFNFESIFSASTRAKVMGRVMGWVNPTCAGRASTIDGNHGPNVINGTPGDDVIVGLGGDDQIFGWGGDDIICGGPHEDVIDGGEGNDWIASFDGDDTLLGGPGDDALRSGPGNDLLKGGSENDWLGAGPGKDKALGGGGNDRIKGGPGRDNLSGQGGRRPHPGRRG